MSHYTQVLQDHADAMQKVLACLLDHYLTCYGQNDGQDLAGGRDALAAEAERLVPNWRQLMEEWAPAKAE